MSDKLDIHALADGQLDGEAKADAAEQILKDPTARAEYESVVLLKQTLKRTCPPTPEPVAWKAAMSRLDEIDRSKRAEVFIGRNAWALCGLFIVMIFSMAMFNRATGRNKLYTGDMARMMSSMVPLPFTNQEPSEVQRKVQDELGETPFQVPADGLHATQMSRGFFDGRRALLVNLEDPNGPAALLIIENIHEVEGLSHEGGEQAFSVGKLNGVNAIAWQSSEFICLLVGERDVQDLHQAATRIRVVR
jgi:hypothetical protein